MVLVHRDWIRIGPVRGSETQLLIMQNIGLEGVADYTPVSNWIKRWINPIPVYAIS